MKKQVLFSCLMLISTMAVMAQSAKPGERYINYTAWFGEALRGGFQSGNTVVKQRPLKEIQAAAAMLGDEELPVENIQTIKGDTKELDDEDIFSKRSNSVFVVGKLYVSNPLSAQGLNFDMTGTAFAISADGVCVTNYHMLKDLIRADGTANKDSSYFIVTADKKIYLIDSILAFSKNNDLAVFKVNTHGDKLNPVPLGRPANVGAAVYCISHPQGHFYYFSKGIVARNVTIDSLEVTEGYDKTGKPPVRMEITADYGVGSSGGPILDKYGNLIGVVVSTYPIIGAAKDKDGNDASYIQMMIKDTSPVKALRDLLGKPGAVDN